MDAPFRRRSSLYQLHRESLIAAATAASSSSTSTSHRRRRRHSLLPEGPTIIFDADVGSDGDGYGDVDSQADFAEAVATATADLGKFHRPMGMSIAGLEPTASFQDILNRAKQLATTVDASTERLDYSKARRQSSGRRLTLDRRPVMFHSKTVDNAHFEFTDSSSDRSSDDNDDEAGAYSEGSDRGDGDMEAPVHTAVDHQRTEHKPEVPVLQITAADADADADVSSSSILVPHLGDLAISQTSPKRKRGEPEPLDTSSPKRRVNEDPFKAAMREDYLRRVKERNSGLTARMNERRNKRLSDISELELSISVSDESSSSEGSAIAQPQQEQVKTAEELQPQPFAGADYDFSDDNEPLDFGGQQEYKESEQVDADADAEADAGADLSLTTVRVDQSLPIPRQTSWGHEDLQLAAELNEPEQDLVAPTDYSTPKAGEATEEPTKLPLGIVITNKPQAQTRATRLPRSSSRKHQVLSDSEIKFLLKDVVGADYLPRHAQDAICKAMQIYFKHTYKQMLDQAPEQATAIGLSTVKQAVMKRHGMDAADLFNAAQTLLPDQEMNALISGFQKQLPMERKK